MTIFDDNFFEYTIDVFNCKYIFYFVGDVIGNKKTTAATAKNGAAIVLRLLFIKTSFIY